MSHSRISSDRNQRMTRSAITSVSTLLMTASLVSAIAAPGYSQTLPSDSSGTSPSDSGDVIIDTGSPGSTTTPNPGLAGNRFTCQLSSGQYTVLYQPESQPNQRYPWAVPSAMGGGWDASRRCYEISRRLESYRPDGLLEMQTAVENGYNTVCVTTQRVPGCRIVLTVPPGQDPISTRDRVFQNLTIADSGQQTQGVNTFVGNQSGGILGEVGRWLNIKLPGNSGSPSYASGNINLRPFLDQADGGTAQFLQRGRAAAPGRRLNPNRFR